MTQRSDKAFSKVRWGIVGCGSVTEVKSGPAYQQTEGFELVAVMRRDMAKAKDYAERHGVSNYYSDAEELIHSPEVDAVYIATPPDSHLHYALKVAAAGKPCCVEKPMASSYNECLEMQKVFAKRDLPLFVAYYRRSLPRFEQVKNWLNKREIGEVRHISWHLSSPPNKYDLSGEANWRTDPAVAYGGYFDDLASHGLDLFVYLLREFKEVSGIAINQQGLYGAKDAVAAAWLHEDGVTGAGSWNFGSSTQEDSVSIYGSKGHIKFAVFADFPLLLSNKSGEQEVYIENPKHIQLPHVQNIQKHFSGEAQHPSVGGTALHTSWVMDKMLGRIA